MLVGANLYGTKSKDLLLGSPVLSVHYLSKKYYDYIHDQVYSLIFKAASNDFITEYILLFRSTVSIFQATQHRTFHS